MSQELAKAAVLFASVRDHLCPTFPFSSYHSPPIPALRQGSPCFVVLVGRGEYSDSESGYQIWQPHLIAIFDAIGGTFRELRSISQETLTDSTALGVGMAPTDKLEVGYIERQIEYCEAADAVAESMLPGASPSAESENLESKFLECAEGGLASYFRAYVGAEIGVSRSV